MYHYLSRKRAFLSFWLSVVFAWFSFLIGSSLLFVWTHDLLLSEVAVPSEWIPSTTYYVQTYYLTRFYARILGYLFGGIIYLKLGRKRTIAMSLSIFILLALTLGASYNSQNIFLLTVLEYATNFIFSLAFPSFASYIVDLWPKKKGISFGVFATMFPLFGTFAHPWAKDLGELLFAAPPIVDFGYGSLIIATLLSTVSLVISRKIPEDDNYSSYKDPTAKTELMENKIQDKLVCMRIFLAIIFALTLAEILLMLTPLPGDYNDPTNFFVYFLYISGTLAGGGLIERFRKDYLLLLIILTQLLVFIVSPAISWLLYFLAGFKMPVYYFILGELSPKQKAASFLATGAVVSGVADMIPVGLIFFNPLVHQVGKSPYFLPLLVSVVVITFPLMFGLRKTMGAARA